MPRKIVCFLALIALGCAADSRRSEVVEIQTARSLDALVSTRRPTALLLWAPWCEDCLELMPAFDRLAKQRGGAVTLAAVCIVEADEDIAGCGQAEAKPVGHYVWKRPLRAALAETGVDGLPALLLFDKRGKSISRLAFSDIAGDFGIPDMADAIDALTP